ncbi:VOC family protein [Levilactobacillus yonginensis]|uniref:glyoxalase n=1 Tax=Levilactobacillus yonginensis TaxID=1054041 RepID=UPI000F792CB6|nr:glyoxalase [Levilactobacillus yonginensis]
MQKTRVMLYVDNVALVVKFWRESFETTTVAESLLPDGSTNIVLAVPFGVELSFFSNEFIKKYSPEVLGNQPSIMFFSDDFEGLHERLAGATPISDDNGQPAFGFPDPEGHYFAIGKA